MISEDEMIKILKRIDPFLVSILESEQNGEHTTKTITL